jgi:hypothetical protein
MFSFFFPTQEERMEKDKKRAQANRNKLEKEIEKDKAFLLPTMKLLWKTGMPSYVLKFESCGKQLEKEAILHYTYLFKKQGYMLHTSSKMRQQGDFSTVIEYTFHLYKILPDRSDKIFDSMSS